VLWDWERWCIGDICHTVGAYQGLDSQRDYQFNSDSIMKFSSLQIDASYLCFMSY
jgi:hypothetical protein